MPGTSSTITFIEICGKLARKPTLASSGLISPVDRLVESGFADTEGLKDARRENLVATAIEPQPRDDFVLHHRLHLARDPRHHHQMSGMIALQHRHAKAGRGAERIGITSAVSGKQRLLDVVLGHHAADRFEHPAHVIDRGLVAPQFLAGQPRDRLRRQVIRRRSDTAGREHYVAQFHRGSPRPFQALRHVADGQHRDQVDPDLVELVGQVIRIAIDHLAGGDFVAGESITARSIIDGLLHGRRATPRRRHCRAVRFQSSRRAACNTRFA